MSKNIKTIEVKFSQLWNNPTFKELFSRWQLNVGEWIPMSVNHKHYSDIVRLATMFGYEVK